MNRTGFGIGLLLGLLIAVSVALWWQSRGPSEGTVQKTVVTTIQEESPASFLVTGALKLNARVRIDSSQYLTPEWLTLLMEYSQPGAALLLQGGAAANVEVPGKVSYGFDVEKLTPSMVRLRGNNRVDVRLPTLSVYSVEPALEELRIRTQKSGWMRVLPSSAPDTLRERALRAVEEALRSQAERRLRSATQPQINTARAIRKMLRAPLAAAGIDEPAFRIRIGEQLVLEPKS